MRYSECRRNQGSCVQDRKWRWMSSCHCLGIIADGKSPMYVPIDRYKILPSMSPLKAALAELKGFIDSEEDWSHIDTPLITLQEAHRFEYESPIGDSVKEDPCKCKKKCTQRCRCVKRKGGCTESCKCGGDCGNPHNNVSVEHKTVTAEV